MHKIGVILSFIVLIASIANAQKPGSWTSHFCYRNTHTLADGGDKIYCAVENAIFSCNKEDGSVETLTKVGRLTDVGVTTMAYDAERRQLIVGYANGNIDLVAGLETVSIPYLKMNKIIPNKSILNILIDNDLAYLSTDFGIAIVDLKTNEFIDTYFIGANATYVQVNQIALQKENDRIWAATNNGLYYASLSSTNLADNAVWSLFRDQTGIAYDTRTTQVASIDSRIYVQSLLTDSTPPTLRVIEQNIATDFKKQFEGGYKIAVSQNRLHIIGYQFLLIYDANEYLKFSADSSSVASIYFTTAITDESGTVWCAESSSGLINMNTGHSSIPNGTYLDQTSDIEFINQNDFRATFGSRGSFRQGGYALNTGSWLNQISWNTLEALTIVQDPLNKEGFYFAGVSGGIHHHSSFYTEEITYTPQNSILEYTYDDIPHIFDLAFDRPGNLWVANWNATSAIKVLDKDGIWHTIKYPNQAATAHTSKIIVDRNNYKWIVDNDTYPAYAYDESGTFDNLTDDHFAPLGMIGGEDEMFANFIHTIVEDNDGAIWIGTDNGVAVYSSASSVFSDSNPQFRRVKVEIDSIIDYVLEGIDVISIAIDAGNRKWFGTANNGLFLMSENGTEMFKHFTIDNSPLPSNNIKTLAIRPQNGEVFIGTDKGLVAYLSDAEAGVTEMDKIKVVPNPVRENYTGEIYISGLVVDASVKITDIAGNLVYETVSHGGTATWPGLNLLGNRPQTGVYLIFISNEDGSETRVGKLMFIN